MLLSPAEIESSLLLYPTESIKRLLTLVVEKNPPDIHASSESHCHFLLVDSSPHYFEVSS